MNELRKEFESLTNDLPRLPTPQPVIEDDYVNPLNDKGDGFFITTQDPDMAE